MQSYPLDEQPIKNWCVKKESNLRCYLQRADLQSAATQPAVAFNALKMVAPREAHETSRLQAGSKFSADKLGFEPKSPA